MAEAAGKILRPVAAPPLLCLAVPCQHNSFFCNGGGIKLIRQCRA
jgi:hypothetical protein